MCGGGNGRGDEGYESNYEDRRHHESATQTCIITKHGTMTQTDLKI
jgi:hypothetical protein